MSHIIFSLRTFFIAVVMLASSFIVRPMLSDPAPMKVEEPVQVEVSAETEEAAEASLPLPLEEMARLSVADLVDMSDVVFVGRIVERSLGTGADRTRQVERVEVLRPLVGDLELGETLQVSFVDGTDQEALAMVYGNRNKEAYFFLNAAGDVYVPSTHATSLLAVENGRLLVSRQFELSVNLPESVIDDARLLSDLMVR